MRGAEVLIVQNDIEQRPDSLTSGSDHLGQGPLTDFVATVSGMRSLAKGASNRSPFSAPAIAARRFALILTFTGAPALRRFRPSVRSRCGSLDTDHRRLLLQFVLFPVRSDVETQ